MLFLCVISSSHFSSCGLSGFHTIALTDRYKKNYTPGPPVFYLVSGPLPSYLRTLLSSYCASLASAQTILLEFNYRWNIKLDGRSNARFWPSVGGLYDPYDVETIQRDTASWNPDKSLFSEWVSVLDVEETGGRSGLSESSWGSHGGGHIAKEGPPSRDLPADYLGGEGTVESTVPLPKLTRTAKHYASMIQTGLSIIPVHAGVEKRNFVSELVDNYFRPGDPREILQQFQRINFDKWGVAWNAYCTKVESTNFIESRST